MTEAENVAGIRAIDLKRQGEGEMKIIFKEGPIRRWNPLENFTENKADDVADEKGSGHQPR
jgi:hypothetical protein